MSECRINDSADGFAELPAMLTDAGDTATDPIPEAIERGPQADVLTPPLASNT